MQLAAMTVLHPIPFDEDDGVADEVTLSLLPGYPRQRITEVGLSIKMRNVRYSHNTVCHPLYHRYVSYSVYVTLLDSFVIISRMTKDEYVTTLYTV